MCDAISFDYDDNNDNPSNPDATDCTVKDNAMWSYFGTWEGEFIITDKTYTLSEKYTETDMLKKVYTSDKVITLDELPD